MKYYTIKLFYNYRIVAKMSPNVALLEILELARWSHSIDVSEIL